MFPKEPQKASTIHCWSPCTPLRGHRPRDAIAAFGAGTFAEILNLDGWANNIAVIHSSQIGHSCEGKHFPDQESYTVVNLPIPYCGKFGRFMAGWIQIDESIPVSLLFDSLDIVTTWKTPWTHWFHLQSGTQVVDTCWSYLIMLIHGNFEYVQHWQKWLYPTTKDLLRAMAALLKCMRRLGPGSGSCLPSWPQDADDEWWIKRKCVKTLDTGIRSFVCLMQASHNL